MGSSFVHAFIVLVVIGFAFGSVGGTFPKVDPYPNSQPTEVTVDFRAQNSPGGTETLQLRTFAAEVKEVLPTPSCPVSGNAEIMLIIDYSGSTEGEILQKEKNAAKIFVDTLARNPQNRIGLATFNSQAHLVSGLTANFDDLKKKIDRLPDGTGSTCIKCGVEVANSEMGSNGRPGIQKAIVLLSDGRANVPSPTSEAERLTLAAVNAGFSQHKTAFYTVGFAGSSYSTSSRGGKWSVRQQQIVVGVNDVNEMFMKQIAGITGGKYYFSPTQDDLVTVFRELGLQLICHPGQALPSSIPPTSAPIPTP